MRSSARGNIASEDVVRQVIHHIASSRARQVFSVDGIFNRLMFGGPVGGRLWHVGLQVVHRRC
jgi:hypothetical protein